jgi:hypothetical protein
MVFKHVVVAERETLVLVRFDVGNSHTIFLILTTTA